jgi:chorismate dehydratase
MRDEPPGAPSATTGSGGGTSTRHSRAGAPVRVGHIEYPLYFGLEQRARARDVLGQEPPDFELVPGVPTDLNRMLVSGTIDFGPISSIAYARNHARLRLSPRLSISSKGAVDSIQLVSRVPLERIRRVAMTPKSATTVVLVKCILGLRYDQDVRYSELLTSPVQALEDHDAVLLIGDEALEALYFPLPDVRLYDLGHIWQEWTGVPMVYAVWAAREEFTRRHPAELLTIEEELVRSMDYGRAHVGEVVEGAVGLSRFERPCLTRYFGVLFYDFAPEYRAGLRRFYELAHEAGELPEVPELDFFGPEGER